MEDESKKRDLKKDTKKMLREYEDKKQSLVNIPKQIAILELKMRAIRGANTDGTPVRGGGNKREEAMIENISKREELEMLMELARRETELLEDAMAGLSKEEQLILRRMYIRREKYALDRLCEELGYEKNAIYARRDTAIMRLTNKMFGRDEI